MNSAKWRAIQVAVMYALVAACGSSHTSTGPSASTTSLTNPVTTNSTVATTTSTASASTSTSTTIATSLCTNSAMLMVVRAALPLPPPDKTVRIDIGECGHGYARVFAVPSNTNCGKPGGSCYNNEQVFLEVIGGHWTVLDNGTGINCQNPQTVIGRVASACKALGLS